MNGLIRMATMTFSVCPFVELSPYSASLFRVSSFPFALPGPDSRDEELELILWFACACLMIATRREIVRFCSFPSLLRLKKPGEDDLFYNESMFH